MFVTSSVTNCAQTLYALRVLRAHGVYDSAGRPSLTRYCTYQVLGGTSRTRPTNTESTVSCAVESGVAILSTQSTFIRIAVHGIGTLRSDPSAQHLLYAHRSPANYSCLSKLYIMRPWPHNRQLPPVIIAMVWSSPACRIGLQTSTNFHSCYNLETAVWKFKFKFIV